MNRDDSPRFRNLASLSTPRLQLCRPHPSLAHLAFRYGVVEFSHEASDFHFPELGPIIAVPLRGDCFIGPGRAAPVCALTGLSEAIRHHWHGPNSAVAFIHLRPTSLAGFLGMDGADVCGQTIELSALGGRWSGTPEFAEKLHASKGNQESFRLIDQFLSGVAESSTVDTRIFRAIRYLASSPRKSIHRIADQIGCSQSALERSFRKATGLTPKRF